MYEYVQTATGWVLCWGGKALYEETARPEVHPARDAYDAETETPTDREPVQAQSA